VIISTKWKFYEENAPRTLQLVPYNKMNPNLIGEILRFLDMREGFKLGLINKYTLNAYYRYCQKLPFLLLELNKKARLENQQIAETEDVNNWSVCYYEDQN